jgi:metal-responsive CopG/Arc/MetJ family transcriptional regulator
VAKVMISLPDDLLAALDAEAARRETSRSALLQAAARRELRELTDAERGDVLAQLDQLSRHWRGPLDAAALIRAERSCDR